MLVNWKLFLQTLKLSDIVDNEVVKNAKSNTLKKSKYLRKKIPDATILIHINQCKTDTQNLGKKIGYVYKTYQIQVVQ